METDKKKEPKIVQTYAEDMAKVIEDDKGGLIKKIIHGEEEREIEKVNLSPESKKNKLFMLISIVLLVLASTTLSFFFFKKSTNTVFVENQFVPLIFNDQNTLLEVLGLKKDEIAQAVLNEVNNAKVKNGGVEGIYLTENNQRIWLRRFISLINGNFVLTNMNSVSDNFLMGVVNKDFFILLKVRTLPDVFDSMRAWENKMFFDLHGFFGIDVSSETKYLLTKNFENGIVENKNARILYDQNNKIAMMYVLADDNSVIITNTENATREIMLRLASGRVKK